jgi:hypothetical protein
MAARGIGDLPNHGLRLGRARGHGLRLGRARGEFQAKDGFTGNAACIGHFAPVFLPAYTLARYRRGCVDSIEEMAGHPAHLSNTQPGSPGVGPLWPPRRDTSRTLF